MRLNGLLFSALFALSLSVIGCQDAPKKGDKGDQGLAGEDAEGCVIEVDNGSWLVCPNGSRVLVSDPDAPIPEPKPAPDPSQNEPKEESVAICRWTGACWETIWGTKADLFDQYFDDKWTFKGECKDLPGIPSQTH